MVGRFIQQQQQRRLRPANTQARPARSRSPPLSVPAICSAAVLRKAKRASAAWASLSDKFGIEPAQIVENAAGRIEQADMLVEHGDAIGQAADVSRRRARDRRRSGAAGWSCPSRWRRGSRSARARAPRTTAGRTGGARHAPSPPPSKATSSRLPGSAVFGSSIASGVRISTRARASSSASARSPIRRSARRPSRAPLFSARCCLGVRAGSWAAPPLAR